MKYYEAIEIVHPLEAKLRALFEGVLICGKNGIKRAIVEVDCLILVESLKKETNLSWDFMFTYKKLLDFLKAFDIWKITLQEFALLPMLNKRWKRSIKCRQRHFPAILLAPVKRSKKVRQQYHLPVNMR